MKTYTYTADFRYNAKPQDKSEISINEIAQQQNKTLIKIIWRILFNNKHITHLRIISDYCSQDIERILAYAEKRGIEIIFEYQNTTALSMKQYKSLSRAVYNELIQQDLRNINHSYLKDMCESQKLLDENLIINNFWDILIHYNSSMKELNPEKYTDKQFYNPIASSENLLEFAVDWAKPYNFVINNYDDDKELFTIAIQILWYIQVNIRPVLKIVDDTKNADFLQDVSQQDTLFKLSNGMYVSRRTLNNMMRRRPK